MSVLVLDKNKVPLTPCSHVRARILLKRGRAVVFRRYPFTIIIKDRLVEDSVVKECKIKIDPGSKVTGIAVIQKIDETTEKVVLGINLEHRGEIVKIAISKRNGVRRNRRLRKTRYRQSRFSNRTGKWRRKFSPSLESRMCNIITWVRKLIKFCPLNSISFEFVNFDQQKMQNPDIQGKEYQQGTLFGYEVKQYLLEKWNYKCAYCNKSNCKLQVEHVVCKRKGGFNRISNLVVACKGCNDKKGKLDLDEFLMKEPDLLRKIKSQLKSSLKDTSAVSSTKNELLRRLNQFNLPVSVGYGYETKFNRTRLNFPKDHWIDAACIGKVENLIVSKDLRCLEIKSMGHGSRQMCRTDKYGVPKCHKLRNRCVKGFRTGDICRVGINKGKYRGIYVGKISIRSSGVFNICGVDSNYKNFIKLHTADGYMYY